VHFKQAYEEGTSTKTKMKKCWRNAEVEPPKSGTLIGSWKGLPVWEKKKLLNWFYQTLHQPLYIDNSNPKVIITKISL